MMEVKVTLELTYEDIYFLRRCVKSAIGNNIDDARADVLKKLDIVDYLQAKSKELNKKFDIL